MVEVSGFTVKILVDGDEKSILLRDGKPYVPLEDGDQYSIFIKNDTKDRAEVEIFIDEDSVGEVRLDGREDMNIKRWINKDKGFLFKRDDSYKALKAGITPGAKENGLIRVEFRPESSMVSLVSSAGPSYWSTSRRRSFSSSPSVGERSTAPSMSAAPMASLQMAESSSMSKDYSSGATVEGAKTYQTFRTVSRLKTDKSKYVTIVLRLIVIESKTKKPYDYRSYPPPVEW